MRKSNLLRAGVILGVLLMAQSALAGDLAFRLMTPVVKIYAGPSAGSGVVLRGTEVLTNAHVVGGEKRAKVIIFVWEDRRKIVGRLHVDSVVMKVDKEKDLALLQLDCILEAPPVEFATEEGLDLLTPIVHVGAPFDNDIQIFRGVVTDQDYGGLIQTDAFAQPGCSGGALWVEQDGKWKLLGILTQSYRGTSISFFIPISTIRKFL